jgi:hypothetical protein
MRERLPMKLHRTFSRWSATAELVPEWMWYAHFVLAAVGAIAVAWKFELPLWVGVALFVVGTALLTLGLFHRVTVWLVAALGSVVAIAVMTLMIGGLLTALLPPTIAVGLGALTGAWCAFVSYRPLIRRLRQPSGSNAAERALD